MRCRKIMSSPLSRIRHPHRASADKHRGAATDEFAVVAPFLFALLIGVLEFSRILMAHPY
jgi:Flp pilus assembly protein TadG